MLTVSARVLNSMKSLQSIPNPQHICRTSTYISYIFSQTPSPECKKFHIMKLNDKIENTLSHSGYLRASQ